MTETGNQRPYYSYWGKAQPLSGSGSSFHPLPYHSIDVAAVGKAVLGRSPRLSMLFQSALGIQDGKAVADWLCFFLALHDIGKFAQTFQGLHEELLFSLQGVKSNLSYSVRHDNLGFALWQSLWPELKTEDVLGFGGYRGWQDGLDALMRAVTGHHGQPPTQSVPGNRIILSDHFTANDRQAAKAFIQDCVELLLSHASREAWKSIPARDLEPYFKVLSNWLAGVAVLADWLGSNQDFFPYESAGLSLEDYWTRAEYKAEKAVKAAGIEPASSSSAMSFAELFDDLPEPTPLQKLVGEVPLGEGPQLFVLEDVTGAGKTEASLVLANRIMAAGLADGVYLGLPTMATANGIYRRMKSSYRRLFAPNSQPNLVLAHSAARYSDEFRPTVLADDPGELDHLEQDETATARCSAWLADNRKKALLAQFGVGTLDQALQAILPNKHQSLRLLGLFGKLLIVDEVHAYDAYMHRLLCSLLRFHAMSGGSAVLLSATLPRSMRRDLVNAFCQGRHWPSTELRHDDYPLLTHMSAEDRLLEQPVKTRKEVRRQVNVDYISDARAVYRAIRDGASAGQCVCWIRNTVHDAVQAYLEFKKLGLECSVFHGRFALGDRLDIENQVLDGFGPKSSSVERYGQILIATQVVEQSLDLDFDLMISDLAPIDSLLQRAGRLHRHSRDETGEPADLDARGTPRLMVYGPPLDTEPQVDWYSSYFPKGAYVYPDHARLWLTASKLQRLGGFSMPEDARGLIEGVYSESAVEFMPEGLVESHSDARGDEMANASSAACNTLRLEDGYVRGQEISWWEDALTPTRLGERSTQLRLFRWAKGKLEHWHKGHHSLHMSQLQIAQYWAKEAVAPTEEKQLKAWEQMLESLPDKARWSVPMLLAREGNTWCGRTKDSRGRECKWNYDPQIGLRRAENTQ